MIKKKHIRQIEGKWTNKSRLIKKEANLPKHKQIGKKRRRLVKKEADLSKKQTGQKEAHWSKKEADW